MKHTKGEWEIQEETMELQVALEDTDPFSCIDITCNGKNIVLIPTDWDTKVAKANAKLIAAAPKLLEALRTIVLLADRHGATGPPRIKEILDLALEEIQKATA